MSYNVPPYGRAGLYKQLAELKALIAGRRQRVLAGLRPGLLSGLRCVAVPGGGLPLRQPVAAVCTDTAPSCAHTHPRRHPPTHQNTVTSQQGPARPSKDPSWSCWPRQGCR